MAQLRQRQDRLRAALGSVHGGALDEVGINPAVRACSARNWASRLVMLLSPTPQTPCTLPFSAAQMVAMNVGHRLGGSFALATEQRAATLVQAAARLQAHAAALLLDALLGLLEARADAAPGNTCPPPSAIEAAAAAWTLELPETGLFVPAHHPLLGTLPEDAGHGALAACCSCVQRLVRLVSRRLAAARRAGVPPPALGGDEDEPECPQAAPLRRIKQPLVFVFQAGAVLCHWGTQPGWRMSERRSLLPAACSQNAARP